MDEISFLDADTSQFQSMLLALAGPKMEPDSRLWDPYWEWQEWSNEAEEALRYFGGREEKLYATAKPMRAEWMEDQLFPSLFKVEQTNHPYVRPGDIMRTVGHD